ncbi:unnamed protein product [Coccothraustes coccothraustes]
MLALREAEHTNLKLPEAKRPSQAAFGRSRALESTATGTMLSARRSRFFASGSRPSRPLLRREERSAHNWHSPPRPQTHQGWYRSCRQTFKPKKTSLWKEILHDFAVHFASSPPTFKCCFQQEPRFGEHRNRHNAQCAKKPLLRLREPDSVAAAETRRAKPHITGILCAALKHIKDGTF